MNKEYEKVLGTLVQVTNFGKTTTILPITYVGKYGFTVGNGSTLELRCLFTSDNITNDHLNFYAYPLKPDGNLCESIEEVRKYYPEYFI